MKKALLMSFALMGTSMFSRAQIASPFNAITGVVWIDADSNNVRNAGEKLVPGILVTLVSAANDSAVASALSNDDGSFRLDNYAGTGTYYLNYVYPGAGFVPVSMRAGTEDLVSSAADSLTVGYIDDNTVSTPLFTIASNEDLTTFGLGLHRIETTLTYWASQPMTPTSWSRSFRLPKSNNNTAVANRATILVTEAVLHPGIGFENTGAGADDGVIEGSGRISLTLPAGTMPQLASQVSKSVVFSAYDGMEDYDGLSGYSWQNSQSATHGVVNITNPTHLASGYRSAAYRDSLSISASAVSSTTITGSANLKASISTISGAGVFITYRYPAVIPLPLKAGSFTGLRRKNTAVLSWEAAGTSSSERFIIERSINGSSFEEIATVLPANTGSRAITAYSFTDESPARSINYYRLKIEGGQGKADYSPVITLSFGNTGSESAIAFPNPATTTLSLRSVAGSRFVLLNALGQTVAAETVPESGMAQLRVAALPEGVYMLRAEGIPGARPSMQRIVIRHP